MVRFALKGRVRHGVVEQEVIREISGSSFGRYRLTDVRHRLDEVKLLAPCQPSKIVALALNYRAHIEEMKGRPPDEPSFFIKPSTAVIGPEDSIVYPKASKRVDYEGELGVVIGKRAKGVPQSEALSYILGYTCVNDVTARDIQPRPGQFIRSKGFDTFAPMGPFIETELDAANAWVETYLNGQLRQSSSTSDLIFGVPKLIEYITEVMTLLPGDVIATGTPSGVGPMQPGDVVEIRIRGIGSLRNRVVAG